MYGLIESLVILIGFIKINSVVTQILSASAHICDCPCELHDDDG